MPPRNTDHIKKGAFLIGYGTDCQGYFGPTTKEARCPTATALQKSPAPTVAEIGARIEGVTARLSELAKAIHQAKQQKP